MTAQRQDLASLNLESLIAWLEKQPASQRYDWEDCSDCLVGRYLSAVTGDDDPSGLITYDTLFQSAAQYHEVAQTKPWTFGAALNRARAAPS